MTQSHAPQEVQIRNLKIDPQDIVFIKAILESYEGMVVMRTIEVGKPVIELLIARDFAPVIDRVIQDLQTQVAMEELPAPVSLAPDWP